MNKMPWFQFFPHDWLYDTRVLTDAEKATMIDLLCFMWNAPVRGQLTGHPQDLARMVGREWFDFRVIMEGLKNKNILDLTEADQILTIVSRRMKREENSRESHRSKQKRYADKLKADRKLTHKKSEDIRQKRDKDNDKDRNAVAEKRDTPPADPKAASLPAVPEPVALEVLDPRAPHVEFVERFKASYEAMAGQPFKFGKAQFVIAARLIRDYGMDVCVAKARILGAMCRDRSAWFTREGWPAFSLEKLSSQWNGILEDGVPLTSEQKKQAEEASARLKWEKHDEIVRAAIGDKPKRRDW